MTEKNRHRQSTVPPSASALSEAIRNHLSTLPDFHTARTVGLFCGRPSEPNIAGLWALRPKACAFPRVERDGLSFYFVSSLKDLKPGYAGILEPPAEADRKASFASGDLVLVPGVRFDRFGGRIGTGKGYYDRFLSVLDVNRIGITWAISLVTHRVPQEAHDIRMHRVCTEEGIVNCR